MDVHEKCKTEASRLGYEVIATRPLQFDSKIFVVLAFNQFEYVTWLINSDVDSSGLFSGKYFMKGSYDSVEECYQMAMDSFSERK